MLKHNNNKKKSEEAAPVTPPDGAAPSLSDAPPASPDSETPPAAAAPAPSPIEQELAAAREKHLRLMADFDNFRKRQAREREEFARRATEALMTELLPVLDHLELAVANVKSKDDPLTKGVQMVIDQFVATLAKFDLRPFHAMGEPFDPNRHEALTQHPSADVPAHHVLQQLRRGYTLGGKLLRPAQVVISSGNPEAPAEPGTPAAPAAPPTEENFEEGD